MLNMTQDVVHSDVEEFQLLILTQVVPQYEGQQSGNKATGSIQLIYSYL